MVDDVWESVLRIQVAILQRKNRDAKASSSGQGLVDLYKQDKSYCANIFVQKKNVVYLTQVVIPEQKLLKHTKKVRWYQ